MSNDFIIRLRTKATTEQESFRGLMTKINVLVKLLYTRPQYDENKGFYDLDSYYIITTDRLTLIEAKRMIDTQIEYNMLELFEYVSW